MFEMVTWNALSIHSKKIILLNTAGYYNNLVSHINTMQVNGFLHSDWREMLSIYETPDAIFRDLVSDKN
jgi:predicted Rossmann-fold nucleotide-binding protein